MRTRILRKSHQLTKRKRKMTIRKKTLPDYPYYQRECGYLIQSEVKIGDEAITK